MSRIGRKSIPVPANVDVKIDGAVVTVKGPKGELKHTLAERSRRSALTTAPSRSAGPMTSARRRSCTASAVRSSPT